MRAAAILGLGSSTRDLKPFQHDSKVDWTIGLPGESEGLDAILVFGGDGTVHRHLQALAKLGLPVLVVPAGSGNDFARALGILSVRDSVAGWRKFIAGAANVRSVDLGVITPINHPTVQDSVVRSGERGRPPLNPQLEEGKPIYFSCAAGVGLDGEIARRANALPRWLRAHGGYALSLPAALASFRPFDLKLSVTQGAPTEFCLRTQQPVVAAVFANTPVYGGGMRIAPKAQLDDGLLDICVIRDISKLKLLSLFPSVYLGKHLGIKEVDYFPAESVRIQTDHPRDVYADGEYVGRTPVDIGVAKNALRVIIPG
jgi:diacylglycerol kinase (ATP)